MPHSLPPTHTFPSNYRRSRKERSVKQERILATDLVAYVNSLPRDEMSALTSGIQSEVRRKSISRTERPRLRNKYKKEKETLLHPKASSNPFRVPKVSRLCMWQCRRFFATHTYKNRQWFSSMAVFSVCAGIISYVEPPQTAPTTPLPTPPPPLASTPPPLL